MSFTSEHYNRIHTIPAPRRVVAVIDTNAGRGGGEFVERLLLKRNWNAEVHIRRATPAHLETYKHAIDHAHEWGADRLLVAGGDGTLARTITAMMQGPYPIPISLVPVGTGNIVAGDLWLPRRILPALQLSFRPAHVHWWDVGRLTTGHYFALRASAGHDANTIALVSKRAKQRWRTMAYIIPGVYELMRMSPVEFRLTIDDNETVEIMGATAFVAVTSRLAGQLGIYLSRQIRTDDGLLYAGVLHPQKILLNLPRVIQHRALEAADFDDLVTLYPVKKRVTIDAATPQRTQLDGDLLGYTPFTAEVVPHAVPFITTAAKVQSVVRQAALAAALKDMP